MEVLKRNNSGPLTSPDVLQIFSVCEKKTNRNKNLHLSNMSKFRQLNAHFLCLLQNFRNKQKTLNMSEKNYYFSVSTGIFKCAVHNRKI